MSNSVLSKLSKTNKDKVAYHFKVENGILYKARKAPEIRDNIGDCSYCQLPVYVSPGQLLIYRNNLPTHKSCRRENKI